MQKRLEDKINRSSRKSLIFRGIAENERENWDDTRNFLADIISARTDVSPSDAYDMIERCHRGAYSTDGKKKVKRVIHCLFRDWEDSQYVLNEFRKACIRGEANGISADQKYGDITPARRNQALLVRKQLKQAGTIARGFIDYPAKLMVKYSGADSKFILHEDFSELEIVPRQKNRDD